MLRPLQLELKTHCREATEEDYFKWLVGYLKKGGKITYNEQSNFNIFHDFFYAKRLFELEPRYGSSSVRLIVPEGIDVVALRSEAGTMKIDGKTHGPLQEGNGHNTIYYMDGNFEINKILDIDAKTGRRIGTHRHFVPCYPGVARLISRENPELRGEIESYSRVF